MGLTVFDLFHKLLSYNIGNSLYDLKYNYTIDQIYLLYEKCIKEDLEGYKMQATIMANSLVYTSPNQTKKGRNQVQIMWKKFMDSLTWNKIKEGKKPKSPRSILSAFAQAGVSVKKKKKVQ